MNAQMKKILALRATQTAQVADKLERAALVKKVRAAVAANDKSGFAAELARLGTLAFADTYLNGDK